MKFASPPEDWWRGGKCNVNLLPIGLAVVVWLAPSMAILAQDASSPTQAAEVASSALAPPSVTPSPATPFPAIFDPIAAESMMKDDAWEAHSAKVPSYLPESELSLDGSSLSLADVIASVYRAYPVIEQARLQATITSGEQTTARGAYDTHLQAYTLNQPIGFYETYRHGISAARQLWWGGYFAAGYRIGRGSFQPWYKERETNDGGEFSAAYVQPLLKGRAIDPQRVELFQANLRRQSVSPQIQANILIAALEASHAYLNWLGAGITLRAQTRLLELAETRGEQLEAMIQAKVGKPIDVIVNNQLIAERRGKVAEAELKYWQASAKLSLFLRDEVGNPMIAPPTWLPESFPSVVDFGDRSFEEDFSDALTRRPELQLIELDIQHVRWDMQLACNQLLPQIDFTIEGSQDSGAPASSLRDKSPFELETGLVGEVPYQRRKARGKLQSAQGKIATLDQKRRLQQDKIAIELQIAHAELQTTLETIRQAEVALFASRESLKAYRFAFERGQVDLVFLNLVEPRVTENEIKLIEQQQKWFAALAAKQAALGLDPLEQAIKIPANPPLLAEEKKE